MVKEKEKTKAVKFVKINKMLHFLSSLFDANIIYRIKC